VYLACKTPAVISQTLHDKYAPTKQAAMNRSGEGIATRNGEMLQINGQDDIAIYGRVCLRPRIKAAGV